MLPATLPDIESEIHTFLKKQSQAKRYKWIGQHQAILSRKTVRGSGGVGMLMSLRLYDMFKINVFGGNFIGYISLSCCICIYMCFLACMCYLPPSTSAASK